jgi:hypothetical protein
MARDGILGVAHLRRSKLRCLADENDSCISNQLNPLISPQSGKSEAACHWLLQVMELYGKSLTGCRTKGIAAAPQIASYGRIFVITFMANEDVYRTSIKKIVKAPRDWEIGCLLNQEKVFWDGS